MQLHQFRLLPQTQTGIGHDQGHSVKGNDTFYSGRGQRPKAQITANGENYILIIFFSAALFLTGQGKPDQVAGGNPPALHVILRELCAAGDVFVGDNEDFPGFQGPAIDGK